MLHKFDPIKNLVPGTALAGVIALAATFVANMHGGPQLLYALLFGVAFHYLSHDPKIKIGIEFCAKTILRIGVGFLGARITTTQITELGWTTVLIVVVAVMTTMLMGLWVSRRLGLSRSQGMLSGGAVAICGASAAMAISAVLPRNKNSEQFTLMVVVTVTVLSTITMVIYPLIVRFLNLSPELAGLFLGGTIHDVAQVVGAGYTIDHATGDFATIVKLFRVSLLAVVVVIVSAAFKKERAASASDIQTKRQGLVPWFLWVFVVLVIANSLNSIPHLAQEGLNYMSRTCLVLSISALGMKTSFAQLAAAGWRPFLALLIETLWIAALVLLMIEARIVFS